MKVILLGSTGMVGQGVQREYLTDAYSFVQTKLEASSVLPEPLCFAT